MKSGLILTRCVFGQLLLHNPMKLGEKMTIKELKDYQVICSKGSLGRAAKDLFITPQGLGYMLKSMEAELECTLVNRVASGLELTESGECLLEYAQKVTAEYDKMRDKIESIQGSVHGSVELLIAYDVIRLLAPESFWEFQGMYPQITFSCREYPDRVAEQQLAASQGDAAISFGPFAEDLFYVEPLLQCPLSLLVYEGHPLCQKTSVTVEDMMGQPLYLENSNFKINEYVYRKCWLKGFEPDIRFEANSFDICYKMCRMKKGISVVPDFVHEDMKTEGLVRIPFADSDMALEAAFLIPKNRTREYAVDTFCSYLKNSLG